MARNRLILPPEYKDLVIENLCLQRELTAINGYAARLAEKLCGQQFNCQECRAGKPDGQPDAPSFRTGAALTQ